MRFLNKREVKRLLAIVHEPIDKERLVSYIFVQDGERIYIASRDIMNVPLNELAVRRVGLIFGILEGNRLHLTKEASYLFLP